MEQTKHHGLLLQHLVTHLTGHSGALQGVSLPPPPRDAAPAVPHALCGAESIPSLLDLGMRPLHGPPGSNDNAFPHVLALQFFSGVHCEHSLQHGHERRPRVHHGMWSGKALPAQDYAGKKRLSRLRALWKRVARVHSAATQVDEVASTFHEAGVRERIQEAAAQGNMDSWWKSALACDRVYQEGSSSDVERFPDISTADLVRIACGIDLAAGGVVPSPA